MCLCLVLCWYSRRAFVRRRQFLLSIRASWLCKQTVRLYVEGIATLCRRHCGGLSTLFWHCLGSSFLTLGELPDWNLVLMCSSGLDTIFHGYVYVLAQVTRSRDGPVTFAHAPMKIIVNPIGGLDVEPLSLDVDSQAMLSDLKTLICGFLLHHV